MHPLSNTREGMIQIAAAVANLGEGLLALIDTAGKAALATPSTAAARFIVVDSDANYASLCPLEPGRQIRVKLAGECGPGDRLTVNADSKAVTAGADDPVYLIAEEAGIDGQDVLCRAPAEVPAPPADELPAIAEGDAGKVLRVKEDESGVEFGTPVAELPTPVEGDAGKVLTVNAEEDGVEWATPAAGALPAQEPGNPNGSILEVTDGTPAWRDAPVEVPTPTEGENGFILSAVYDNPPQWSPAPMGLPDMTGVGPSAVLGVDADTPSWRSGASLVEMLEAIVAALPTSNPYDPGKLYVDGDTIKISAGI
jgi:hypothetical protein